MLPMPVQISEVFAEAAALPAAETAASADLLQVFGIRFTPDSGHGRCGVHVGGRHDHRFTSDVVAVSLHFFGDLLAGAVDAVRLQQRSPVSGEPADQVGDYEDGGVVALADDECSDLEIVIDLVGRADLVSVAADVLWRDGVDAG